ncbi:MAG: YraN family protein [Bacteroidales bacterium]|nr:YraN family protein [Bacteroidales bacterium]
MSSHFSTKKTGNIGEKFAEEYLKNNGYRIIATNWFYKHKEIDIIAEKDSFLVIVEVKTRAKNYLIDPMYAVTKQKQKFLIEAADHFIQTKIFQKR